MHAFKEPENVAFKGSTSKFYENLRRLTDGFKSKAYSYGNKESDFNTVVQSK